MHKRNQVETAIETIMSSGRSRGRKAPPSLHVRIKRLLETDRSMSVEPKNRDPRHRHYAFFDAPPPGRGVEVTYSDFGAFALLLGVRLMQAGLPQSEAVIFIRRIRVDLEREHARILRQGPQTLLDHKARHGLEDEIKMGRLVQTFDHMVFLVVLSGDQGAHVSVRVDESGRVEGANIARSAAEMTELMAHLASSGGPIFCLELVNPAHQLAYWLSQIEPVKRGRR